MPDETVKRYDSDGPCGRCGIPCECWFTSSELWNRVNGGATGLLCLRCFALRAFEMGMVKHAWMLSEDDGLYADHARIVSQLEQERDALKSELALWRSEHDPCPFVIDLDAANLRVQALERQVARYQAPVSVGELTSCLDAQQLIHGPESVQVWFDAVIASRTAPQEGPKEGENDGA